MTPPPSTPAAARRDTLLMPGPVHPPGFELRAEIGRGGMGVVYRARDLALDRDVAVKLLREGLAPTGEAGRRFLAESRITARLQHPGIPAVYHVGTLPDDRPFLAMKLIQGDTLADRLRTNPDRGRLVAIFEGICQAVGYAHAHGVIHRDLKPANVMVGAFGEVQVMDWGVAKELGSREQPGWRDDPEPVALSVDPLPAVPVPDSHTTPGDAGLTRVGSVLGTPAYMAPEQAAAATDRLDARADVFGLGAVLCTILTGQPPFVGEDVLSTHQLAARAELADAYARLAGCGADPDLVALCRRCLSAAPDDRPADAGAVAAAVAKLRTAADDRARRAELAVAEGAVRRRLRLRLGGLAMAVLVAGAGVSGWQAIRATVAERAIAAQLDRTREAEADARREADHARAAEKTAVAEGERAKAEEAKAKVSEGRALAQEGKARDAEQVARRAEQMARDAARMAVAEGERAKASETRAKTEEGKAVAAAELARRREREAVEAAADTQAFSDFLTGKILAAARPAGQQGGMGREVTLAAALRAADTDLDKQFAGRPTAEAAARHALGVTWRNLGDYDRAAGHLTRAVELRRKELGPTHRDTLASLSSLSVLHQQRGDPAAAERLAREALAGRRQALGDDDPATLTSVSNLALMLRQRGDRAAAEPLLREAVAGRRRVLTTAHPDTLVSVHNLATFYMDAGDLAAAEPLLVEAVAGFRKALTDTHPDTLLAVHNLAEVYRLQGRFREAGPLHREALAGSRKALGDPHPTTLTAAAGLGRLLHDTGDLTAAEPLLREALAGRRKALTDDHPDTVQSVFDLAALLLDRRQFAAAAPLYREALTAAEKRPDKTAAAIAARTGLGLALLGAGKPVEAEPHLLAGYQSLSRQPARGPADRDRLRRVTLGLVEVYVATGRPAEAAAWRAKRTAAPPELAPPPRAAR